MPTPGLLFVNSKITSEELSPEAFTKWYNDVHIPDIFTASPTGITKAFRYKSVDPKADRPYLALYPLDDFDFLGSNEFKSIPVKSTLMPGPSHLCFDFADFDTRYYEHVQTFEPEGTQTGPAPLVISAALSPALGTDSEFDAWYRQEHLRDLATVPTYRRTRRYKLKYARQNRNPDDQNALPEPPKYLAIHEFDAEPPERELAATGETEWAKKIMGSLASAEVGKFGIIGKWGNTETRWAPVDVVKRQSKSNL